MPNQNPYQEQQTKDVIAHIVDAYEAEPEFLWEKYPGFCIFRNDRNQKWFALIGKITARQLGLERDGDVEVLNLRFDRHAAPDFVKTHQNFSPAYHMNKDNWYSIFLDGGLENSAIFALIAKSFELINT